MAVAENDIRSARILIADDEEDLREVLRKALEPMGAILTLAKSGDEALYYLRRQVFDLVVCDQKMPGADGTEVLQFARELKPSPPIFIFITARATIELAVEAMRAGAYDFISKPFRIEEFRNRVAKALNAAALENENRTLRQTIESHYVLKGIIGTSKPLRHALDLAVRAAEHTSPVLLLGESGTGKDLLARAIHFQGPRKKKPFIPINCGAIPENLIESEFFGHKRGSFTGATADRRGCFEEVAGGTLFLDEIGEMPFELQVKLLRVLEEHKIRRVGENQERPVDFRIIAATNRSLQQQVEAGAFRQDLYYRLNVFKIDIPPLRERSEDIVLLAEHFLKEAQREMNTRVMSIKPAALAMLQAYDYPGNVRELYNILQRAVLLCDGAVIEPRHLPAELHTGAHSSAPEPLPEPVLSAAAPIMGWDLKDEIRKAQDSVERFMIQRALAETDGNHSRAAALLGISRASLYNKIQATASPAEPSR